MVIHSRRTKLARRHNCSRRRKGAPAGEPTSTRPASSITGCVLGIGLCGYRMLDGSDGFLTLPGDDVEITYPSAGKPPKAAQCEFTVVDFYRKQDERIRLELRLRADSQVARAPRHGRSVDRHRQLAMPFRFA